MDENAKLLETSNASDYLYKYVDKFTEIVNKLNGSASLSSSVPVTDQVPGEVVCDIMREFHHDKTYPLVTLIYKYQKGLLYIEYPTYDSDTTKVVSRFDPIFIQLVGLLGICIKDGLPFTDEKVLKIINNKD